MTERNVDALMAQMTAGTGPAGPGTREQTVLRRIHLAKRETAPSLFDWVLGLRLTTGVILGTVGMAVVVSSGVSIVANQSQVAERQSRVMAANALGFEVFQSHEFFNLKSR